MKAQEQSAYERASKDVVRQVFETCYPKDADGRDTTRKRILGILADTIWRAHAKWTGDWRWSLSFWSDHVRSKREPFARLNVSKYGTTTLVTLDLFSDRICPIVPEDISPELKAMLHSLGGCTKKFDAGNKRRDDMPDPQEIHIPRDHVSSFYPLIEVAHASMVHSYPYAKNTIPPGRLEYTAHSTGLLQYLREELPDRIIPDPSDIAPDRGGDLFAQNSLPLEDDDQSATDEEQGGQGYVDDAKRRHALELYAMECARAYYSPTYEVEDVSQQWGRGYDLLCLPHPENVSGRELHVEVKGTSSSGTEVILTAGEVEHARTHRAHSVLFVVAKIKLDAIDDGYKPSGGVLVGPFDPWIIEDGSLTPTEYRYQVPPTSSR